MFVWFDSQRLFGLLIERERKRSVGKDVQRGKRRAGYILSDQSKHDQRRGRARQGELIKPFPRFYPMSS